MDRVLARASPRLYNKHIGVRSQTKGLSFTSLLSNSQICQPIIELEEPISSWPPEFLSKFPRFLRVGVFPNSEMYRINCEGLVELEALEESNQIFLEHIGFGIPKTKSAVNRGGLYMHPFLFLEIFEKGKKTKSFENCGKQLFYFEMGKNQFCDEPRRRFSGQ